jgi:hypothetical protein
MSDEYVNRDRFFNRRTDKTIWSKSFPDQTGRKLRIVSRIMPGGQGLEFATANKEVVLRQTSNARFQIKATVIEDERKIKTLTIQRYSSKTGPLTNQSYSFVGDEVDTLLEFAAGVKVVSLDNNDKLHVTDEMLRGIVLNHAQARSLFVKHEAIFLEIAQSEDLARDLIAVGYRRKQLEHFDSLLNDKEYFASERARLGSSPEGVWQRFFEANTWIFGYGLSFQFVSSLDDSKLEQIVRGPDVSGEGKRADALMKTRGLISSLCFLEIKRHDTPLLEKEYRPGAWSPSTELAGGVTQVQTTVQVAIERIGRRLLPTDDIGDPTGEILFNVAPRSCLIIGNLAQFQTDYGINENKFRSFELYRRNTWRPEILTFDELLQRAWFIVNNGQQTTGC